MVKATSYLALFLILFSCRKGYDSNECEPPSSLLNGNVSYISSTENYSNPCFNPNNQDEFSFIKWDQGVPELWVGNIKTNEYFFLDSGVYYTPKWGKNNWIVYNLLNNEIYIIRPNGSNKKQLTFNSSINTNPNWSPNGDKIVYRSSKDLSNGYLYIMDTLGNDLERIEIVSGNNPSWSPNGDKIALKNYNGINIYNLVTKENKIINADDNSINFNWIGNDTLLWEGSSGISISCLKSNNITLLSKDCFKKSYDHPTISVDGKIMCREYINEIIDDNNVFFKSDLVLFHNIRFDSKEIISID
ncbi:MAG: hypothetical protein CMP61_08540 [Flavobacteriales bacterium]|nr:hypothetical protein [Flavobacteriales bacterium]|tara:strand:+ start:2308 stop:3213 length:906 start_codon:yes stop_codon:yes gene_type:complete